MQPPALPFKRSQIAFLVQKDAQYSETKKNNFLIFADFSFFEKWSILYSKFLENWEKCSGPESWDLSGGWGDEGPHKPGGFRNCVQATQFLFFHIFFCSDFDNIFFHNFLSKVSMLWHWNSSKLVLGYYFMVNVSESGLQKILVPTQSYFVSSIFLY